MFNSFVNRFWFIINQTSSRFPKHFSSVWVFRLKSSENLISTMKFVAIFFIVVAVYFTKSKFCCFMLSFNLISLLLLSTDSALFCYNCSKTSQERCVEGFNLTKEVRIFDKMKPTISTQLIFCSISSFRNVKVWVIRKKRLTSEQFALQLLVRPIIF